MGIKIFSLVLFLGLLQFSCAETKTLTLEKKGTYIVHMSKSEMPTTYTLHSNWYDSCLKSVSDSAEMLYTYNTIIHGFSTRLTEEQAESLRTQQGILSVLPEQVYTLHTTRTPLFLGIDKYQELIPESSDSTTSDVVIGVLDTGAWPESKSYNDEGVGPIPSNWKGECETSKDFSSTSCNKKLIGARYFPKGYEATLGPIDESAESKSPRDDDGHGTHTSTTAAGSAVANASLFGYAPGTARGMASRARVAVYKVCWKGGCFTADILAAMEKAIEDGVHVLSLSLGGGVSDYYIDSVATGAFTAMEKGILVSCSAGNSGPNPGSLSNVAPWITTVGAGTLDRDFPAIVSLGNGKNYSGVALYDGKGKPLPPNKMVELVYAGDASTASNGNLCMAGTLIPEKVAGKIVLCDRGSNARVAKGVVVKQAGGIGMVLANAAANGEELVVDTHLLPASGVGLKAGDEIKSYLFSDPNPTATIMFAGTKLGVQPAPVVAAFSSRGPNSITPEILKPDLIGPGVNILAGWSGAIGPTGLAVDTRRVEFNIISGTSMSCPHISGLAGLLKGAHPEWSPAAIRSALMTTSYNTYKSGQPLLDTATGNASTPFDHGAGHVDVISALDPGLIYDLKTEDYLDFLCALDYTPAQIRSLAKSNFTCDSSNKYRVADLNYPSFGVSSYSTGNTGTPLVVKHTRTLTNVGTPGTYKASSAITTTGQGKDALKISIEPDSLSFTKMYEKLSYTVAFTTTTMPSGTHVFGRIEWSDGKHIVGSPVAVSWN